MLRADEAPYPGHLQSDDPPTVWVDHALIPDDVWRCRMNGHILVPHDLARTTDGHAAVVPHCPARLRDVIERRVSPGAAVTIAVSMLRAASESSTHGFEHGQWWVDASGRPVLAITGAQPWRESGALLLDELAGTAPSSLAAVLARTGDALSTARLRAAELEALEEELFATAEPSPLTLGQRLRPLTEEPSPRRAASLRRNVNALESHGARVGDDGWMARVSAAVHQLSDAVTGCRAWLRTRSDARASTPAPAADSSPRRRRRAPVVVATAAAAIVIGVGMAWPTDQDVPPARAEAGPTAGTATPSVATEAAAAATGTDTPIDLIHVATDVLVTLSGCTAASAECDTLWETPGHTASGAVTGAPGTHAITLLDEYGGVAVFRVEAPGHTPQILVLVSANGKWLVRAVYDVADQP